MGLVMNFTIDSHFEQSTNMVDERGKHGANGLEHW